MLTAPPKPIDAKQTVTPYGRSAMFIGIASSETEGKMVVVGLEPLNIERLLNDMPIVKDLGQFSDEWKGWKLVILGPEDTVRFIAQTVTPGMDDAPTSSD